MSQHRSLLDNFMQLVEESFAAFSGVSLDQVGHSLAVSNPDRCTGADPRPQHALRRSTDSGIREHTNRADKER